MLGLTVKIDGDASGLGDALDKGGSKVTAFGKSIDLGMIAKATVVTGAIVGVVAVLGEFASAAAQDQLEADQLAGAIAAAGAATGDWSAQVDQAIQRGAELAFSDTQIRDALTPLVGVTGDMARAQVLLTEAEDVARLAKVDLATASEAVAKAEGGQGGALAKLLQINAQGLTSTQVLAAAQAKAAGQASIYGGSTAAAGEKISNAMGELGETIGSALVPLLDAIMPAILPIIEAFGTLIKKLLPVLTPALKVLGAVFGVVGTAIGIVVDVIGALVDFFSKAIAAVGDFIGSLGPVKALGDVIGAIGSWFDGSGAGLAGLAGTSATGGNAGGPMSSVVFNVAASGADPESVVRALRRWAGVNGGWTALERAVGG